MERPIQHAMRVAANCMAGEPCHRPYPRVLKVEKCLLTKYTSRNNHCIEFVWEEHMLRIAVLGCGRIGSMHAANIAAHPRAQLIAIYDVNQSAADTVAAQHGVYAFGSAKEVFASA